MKRASASRTLFTSNSSIRRAAAISWKPGPAKCRSFHKTFRQLKRASHQGWHSMRLGKLKFPKPGEPHIFQLQPLLATPSPTGLWRDFQVFCHGQGLTQPGLVMILNGAVKSGPEACLVRVPTKPPLPAPGPTLVSHDPFLVRTSQE